MTRRFHSALLPAALLAALSGAARADLHAFACQGHLFVLGGSAAEGVTIAGDAELLSVIGDFGTLVNGQSQVSFEGVTKTVWVATGGGNDTVIVSDSEFAASLAIFTGTGNDLVFAARNEIAGTLLVDAGMCGPQSDLVVLNSPTDEGNLIGDDLVVLGRTLTLVARGQEVLGRTGVWSGPGEDLIKLAASSFHGNVRIDTDGGNDQVLLGDAADLVPNTFGGRLDVRLGYGNDSLLVRRSTIAGEARLLGDWGADSVQAAAVAFGNAFHGPVFAAGFESVQ